MKRSDRRIVWATIGVFVWLGGLYATICGLMYDVPREYRWGVLALIVGVATFVIALNPLAQRGSRDGDGAEKT